MPGLMESVATVNSVLRTMIALVVVGGATFLGWMGYSGYRSADLERDRQVEALAAARTEVDRLSSAVEERDRLLEARDRTIRQREAQLAAQAEQIDVLEKDVEAKAEEIARLDTAMQLLKVDRRVARMTVLDQGTDPDTGEVRSLLEFVEQDEQGEPIDEPRRFRIVGDVVYVDYWVVKFDEQYVEEADLLRSTSIVLFRRIFGEYQEPTEGFQLDETGSRPTVYARTEVPSEFEERIWGDFWNIANDPRRAGDLGIRAAHGEAVSIKVEPGRSYKLMLRASDGLSITPEARAAEPSES